MRLKEETDSGEWCRIGVVARWLVEVGHKPSKEFVNNLLTEAIPASDSP